MPSKIKFSDQRRGKPWLRRPSGNRYKVEHINKGKTFLIICEGQTEEQYFLSFPVYSATVTAVPTGRSKTSLVRFAKKILKDQEYDEIWCVFDMDRKPDLARQDQDFNNAITECKQEGFKCAYSNDAFELWLVLHYHYVDQEYHRTFYYEKLSELMNINYEKNGKNLSFAGSLYNRLADDQNASQERAIKAATKLFATHKHKVFHLQNPVTLVYELVKELNKHLRK